MVKQTTLHPFLMFEGKAEEAMNFYVSALPNSRVEEVVRYGPDGPGPEGSIIKASFTVAGQTVLCSDSPVHHSFTFTPSMSFFVTCTSGEEIRRLAGVLGEGGAELMPLGNYGFSQLFAWVADRYGVSWQLNLE